MLWTLSIMENWAPGWLFASARTTRRWRGASSLIKTGDSNTLALIIHSQENDMLDKCLSQQWTVILLICIKFVIVIIALKCT